MTQTAPDQARDTVGRFTSPGNTDPELALDETYLEDDSDGAEFDVDAFYDVQVADDTGMTITDTEWLDQQRAERDACDALSARHSFPRWLTFH